MKIFCLSYSSFIISNKILLLFAMQLLIFFLFVNRQIYRLTPYPLQGLVGSMKIFSNWLLRNQTGLFICALTLCRVWWAQMDSDHRPHAYQACALTSWAMSPYGGGNRVRTDDPLLAGQVLYQLSYTPIFFSLLAKINAPLVQGKHCY